MDRSQQIIKEILKELKDELVGAVWTEFELKFTNSHNEFFDRLLKDHPELTPNEMKMCALIRMNMSSKEISSIIHHTPASVDVARSRIRKKLGMAMDESLVKKLMAY